MRSAGAPRGGVRGTLLWVASLSAVFLTTVGLAEVMLRIFDPIAIGDDLAEPPGIRREPTTNQPDPMLGWIPKPGRYLIPAYAPEEPDIKVTVLAHGERSTGHSADADVRKRIFTIGDSLTFGWAISDEETFAYKLQAKHPDWEVTNLGVIGYGTYQSLLRTQRFIEETGRHPTDVVYQLVDEHEFRNVGSVTWLRILSRLAKRGHVTLPYCLTGDDRWALKCFPPDSYSRWPLDDRSRLVSLLKLSYLSTVDRLRRENERQVTLALLVRMQKELATSGATLHVILAWMDDDWRESYHHALAATGIHHASCISGERYSVRMMVPGEGHPNGRMNDFYAGCVDKYLTGYFSGRDSR